MYNRLREKPRQGITVRQGFCIVEMGKNGKSMSCFLTGSGGLVLILPGFGININQDCAGNADCQTHEDQ